MATAKGESKRAKILDICNITPSSSPLELSLRLSIFDISFVYIPPFEYLFFYSLKITDTDTDPPSSSPFMDSILPKLKHSLSLTLSHFLPLAGHVSYPNHSPATPPFISYKPGDAVSLTVAEMAAEDFVHLSPNHVPNAIQSRLLLPDLKATNRDQESHIFPLAPAMAVQITHFPNSGFSIGIKTNHVVSDGKTFTLFLKSWAHFSKFNTTSLPPELTPSFDRSTIENAKGIDDIYNKTLSWVTPDCKTRNKGLGLFSGESQSPSPSPTPENVARSIFELTHFDINNLRKKVESNNLQITRYLSSFVLAFSHASICMVKSQKLETEGNVALTFLVDWRSRSGLEIPANYFGNAVSSCLVMIEAKEFENENGVALATVSKKVSDAIVEMEEKMKNRCAGEILEEGFSKLMDELKNTSKVISISGSPKFGVYEIDFGFGIGKAMKAERTSLNPGGSIALSDSRNGNGGIEVGVNLLHHEMDIFASLFSNALM